MPGKKIQIVVLLTEKLQKDIEDHIDRTAIKLRREGIKFTKNQMYTHLVRSGINNFDAEDFSKSLKQ